MAVLLKNALKPNLVQTLENNRPSFTRPIRQHRAWLQFRARHQDRAETFRLCGDEAGFGADLGAEKFIDIKCRKSGLRPQVVVIVATIRALKYHGASI